MVRNGQNVQNRNVPKGTIFGKETKGLPEDVLQEYFDKAVRIPMRKTFRSLNLSNAVAIVAYDVLRQAGFDGLEESSSYFEKKWIRPLKF